MFYVDRFNEYRSLIQHLISFAEIMELMDKGEIEQIPEDTNEKKTSSEPECKAWHCLGPLGERPGPFSPALLKIWSELNLGASRYKVWKVGHSPEEAIPLGDALCQLFPEKLKKNLNSIWLPDVRIVIDLGVSCSIQLFKCWFDAHTLSQT